MESEALLYYSIPFHCGSRYQLEVLLESVDKQYADLIRDCLENGDCIQTRNSKVKRVWGKTLTFDSTPLVSVRKTSWKSAIREWEWFMSGSSRIEDLHPGVRHWWEPWANKEGEVKFNYSKQFRYSHGFDPDRHWSGGPESTDQIANLLEGVKKHPYSRRNILTTWNAAEMSHFECKITNCHNSLTQLLVGEDGKLNLFTTQRSCDVVCGLPHNLVQEWAFLLWLCDECDREPGVMKWVGVDIHVYSQHFELAERILDSVDKCKPTPQLVYTPVDDSVFRAERFSLDREYEPVLTDPAVMVV